MTSRGLRVPVLLNNTAESVQKDRQIRTEKKSEERMKSLLSTIIIAIFISLTFATAFAEQSRGETSSQQRDRHRLAYTFVTADISVPGHPDRIAFPEDINDEGVIVTNFFSDGGYALIADPVKRKSTNFKTTTFNCTGLAFADTVAFSINDKGQIAGYCVDAPSAPSKQFGFVRNPNGNHILLDFPGADGTGAFGINDRGQVVGQFYGPLRDDHGGRSIIPVPLLHLGQRTIQAVRLPT